ncbi:ASX homology domain-containing protein [Xylariales sp. AK1849]|nr:ASX homology domain-containing protein [Xylariales sp. AK1849]
MILKPGAWDLLPLAERLEICKMWPNQSEVIDAGTEKARLDFDKVASNNNFRNDATQYPEELREGKHDGEWVSQAVEASKERSEGKYDAYKAARFKESWGVDMPGKED